MAYELIEDEKDTPFFNLFESLFYSIPGHLFKNDSWSFIAIKLPTYFFNEENEVYINAVWNFIRQHEAHYYITENLFDERSSKSHPTIKFQSNVKLFSIIDTLPESIGQWLDNCYNGSYIYGDGNRWGIYHSRYDFRLYLGFDDSLKQSVDELILPFVETESFEEIFARHVSDWLRGKTTREEVNEWLYEYRKNNSWLIDLKSNKYEWRSRKL